MLPKDYVAYRFSGVFATDCSDAAGTLYFDTKIVAGPSLCCRCSA